MNYGREHLAGRLAEIQQRVGQALRAAGRTQRVQVIGVTKYLQAEQMLELRSAGLEVFAENRVQLALEKLEFFSGLAPECQPLQWHFIGHLQRNKVARVVGKFQLLHGVDSLRLAEAVSKAAVARGVIQDLLLEVNVAEEEQKQGFDPAALPTEAEAVLQLPGLRVRGLMGMAPLGSREKAMRSFARLAGLRQDLATRFGTVFFEELSMGMSGDFEDAVAEGATMVRIGSMLYS